MLLTKRTMKQDEITSRSVAIDDKVKESNDDEKESLDSQVMEEETKVTVKKKPKKTIKKKKKGVSTQEVIFTNKTISNLSRGLGANDWIKLAYALGFLPQAIAHFTGRASSAENSYSQCTFMLKTWREITPSDEILPRLCAALQKIRRHDLAVKIGLELAVTAVPENKDEKAGTLFPELLKLIHENNNELAPPFDQSKLVFTDDNVSFLARQLLAREEWKRLAYALGLLPDDASHIIATASSSQNLYAQAHLMLIKWRNNTPPSSIIPKLKQAFIRIRRHDLVFLLDLGIIAAPIGQKPENLEERLQKMHKEAEINKGTLGASILHKFRDLNE